MQVKKQKMPLPPSREDKRCVTVWLSHEAWKQIRQLSLDLETPNQALGREAYNLLFKKYRRNEIA